MYQFSQSSLRRAALQQLESLQRAGVSHLPRPADQVRIAVAQALSPPQASTGSKSDGQRPTNLADGNVRSETLGAASPSPGASPAAASITPNTPATIAMDESTLGPVSSAPTLDVLEQEVAACTLCQELASTRTQTVFGVGNPQSRLCFLGEAPGADEDRQGEPFVGRAGQLLNKILQACGLDRDDVYILNVLKCRPPGNRNPAPEESANCRRYLDRQLQLIKPDFICCLGAVAAQNLLSTTVAIGKLRGAVHQYRGINVVCTYHPAYLLRNPSAKKYAWDDMKLLMRALGTPVD